jgi:predicted phage tail component-like protein
MTSFTFNGERRDYVVVLRGRKRPPWAPVQRDILKVPGLPGGYLQNTETDVRVLEIPILIKGDNLTHLQRVKEDLAAWLVTDEPKELIFDDDPTRTYYAVVDDTVDFEEIVKFGKGTIKFICPDPYVYGPEQTVNIPYDGNKQTVIVQNNGSAPTYPKFTVTFNQPTTFLDIITPTDYMRIGKPASVKDTAIEKEQKILDDNMTTIIGWGSATYVDDGVVTGTMNSDGNDFYASSYGIGTGWHGPAVKKSLSQTVQDFRVEAYFKQYNAGYTRLIGRAEVYLLDANNAVIAKIAMMDAWDGVSSNKAEVRLGDSMSPHYMVNTTGKTKTWWNDFQGVIKLTRIGKRFTAYVANITKDGRNQHYRTWFVGYTDVDERYQMPLAQIQLHLGAYGTYPVTNQAFQRIRVYKINQNNDTQVPYIATAGDVIEIDHATNAIFKNGEPFLSVKDFGANFFALERGQTEIAINPVGIATVQMTFRERWR